ncbi:MAG: 30S ribosomal protein S20 [Planctomycetota bacterium]|nr:MAG: 30S ribosomal protein S20 [Planctomycetota bacterium]
MPSHKAQSKSMRQGKKNNIRNTANRSELKTAVKKVTTAIEKKDFEEASKHFIFAQKLFDKSAKRNLIKDNKAARDKSRLMKRINALKSA